MRCYSGVCAFGGYIFVNRKQMGWVVGGGGMGYTNAKNELKAFVGRVEMATPFNLSKPLNSFNPKI